MCDGKSSIGEQVFSRKKISPFHPTFPIILDSWLFNTLKNCNLYAIAEARDARQEETEVNLSSGFNAGVHGFKFGVSPGYSEALHCDKDDEVLLSTMPTNEKTDGKIQTEINYKTNRITREEADVMYHHFLHFVSTNIQLVGRALPKI